MTTTKKEVQGKDIQVGDEVLYLGEWREVTFVYPSTVERMTLVGFRGEPNVYLASTGYYDVRRPEPVKTPADYPVGTILRNIRGLNYHVVKIAENTWVMFLSDGRLWRETYTSDQIGTVPVFNYEVVTFDA